MMRVDSSSSRIRLVRIDADLFESLALASGFRERFGADVSAHVGVARDVVEQTLAFEQRISASPPWSGYLVVDSATNVVIGSGGSKGNPTADGTVEIAYGTFPEYEGRGFGTATAHELVRIAAAAAGIRTVLAHTLPERNASTRILEKVGFTLVGEVMDPEDGRVWCWHRTLAT